MERPNTQLINLQKEKLSQTNFQLGTDQVPSYKSTTVVSHPAKFVKHFDKVFRLREAVKNNKTNFAVETKDSKID